MVPALGTHSVELAGAGSFPASGAGDGSCLLSLLSPIQITCPGAAGSKSWGISCARAVPPTVPSSLSRCLSSQGTLEGLEEELLAFFSVTPHSVYTALMDNRYPPISGCWGSPCPRAAPACRGALGAQDTPWPPLSQAWLSTWGHPPGLVPVEPLGEGGTWGCLRRALWHFVLPCGSLGGWRAGQPVGHTAQALTLSPVPQLRAAPAPRALPVHGSRLCQ